MSALDQTALEMDTEQALLSPYQAALHVLHTVNVIHYLSRHSTDTDTMDRLLETLERDPTAPN
jgi:hypothetical protein